MIVLLVIVLPLLILGFYTHRFEQDKKLIEEKDSLKEQIKVNDETVYTEGTRSANWKKYSNTKLRISFRYPDNLLPYITEGNDVITLSNVKPPNPHDVGPWNIFIRIEANNRLDVNTYVDSILQYAPEERKSINIETVVAESIVGGFVGASIDRRVFIPYGETILIITMQPYSTGNTEDKQRQEIFDQILSTIRFTQ